MLSKELLLARKQIRDNKTWKHLKAKGGQRKAHDQPK